MQFGAYLEVLAPGGVPSHRHWHAAEDEFLYLLDGQATVIDDDWPHVLNPGACACWPAGVPNAHCLQNRTETPVHYLIIGTRLAEDAVSYPDIDLHYARRGGLRHTTRKDGTPYPGWPKETDR